MWNIATISSSSTYFLRSFIIRSRHHRHHGSNLNFGHLHNSLPFPTNPIDYSICKLNMPIYTADAIGVPPLPPHESGYNVLMGETELEVSDMVERVKTAAERVDKVAEEIAEHLPQGSKLHKTALIFIEDAAERIVKGAYLARDIIDKIEAGLLSKMEKVKRLVKIMIKLSTKEAKEQSLK